MTLAKNKAFERSYQRLETKDGEKDVFKPGKARERKTRNLKNVRCIKDEDDRVLVEETITPQMYIIHCLHSHQLISPISSDIPNDRSVIAVQKGQGLT